ncbi:MAG: nicotinate phosphoribosyltransferase [Phototrophicaceae bacterium]
MTVFDQKRLTGVDFGFDMDAIRRGYYADKYFVNIQHILGGIAQDAKTYKDFGGQSPRELPLDPSELAIGDLEVEAQIFNRRKPYTVVAGVDAALAMLKRGTGYFDGEQFVPTWQNLTVEAVPDGVFTHYEGDPMNIQPVIVVRGRYRDFTVLETTLLGVLSRASRIATNVCDLLAVTNGKPLLFFPARFDMPSVQSIDGYAYWVAVQRHNADTGRDLKPYVSTDAQGAWWGARGGGTLPHSLIASFLADTVATMVAFAEYIPVSVPRTVLADFNNDTVQASLATMAAYWPRYVQALQADDREGQARWTLSGVRLDTGGTMVDVSLQPNGKTGVNEDLVWTVRRALDGAWQAWDVPATLQEAAQAYCRNVSIIVSGGFNRDKIERFEQAGVPVGSYGVGSSLFSNESSLGTNTDFTMDVVQVKLGDQWQPIAKLGRQPCNNPDLMPVDLSQLD